ncbi:peptidase, partial [Achromatium sp. WMS3]
MKDQHIIALGGGGFTTGTSLALDDYILQVADKSCPKICFVPTASGDRGDYTFKFYQHFSLQKDHCKPTHLPLFKRKVKDLVDFACSQDIIYVGGGNTANMLAIWHLHGFDLALQKALAEGVILAGMSAGSICWFQFGVDDSFGEDLK